MSFFACQVNKFYKIAYFSATYTYLIHYANDECIIY